MANQLTPAALLALDPQLVRIVGKIGVSVFTANHAHVFELPQEPAKLKAFCWAHNIPFEGLLTDSMMEKTPDTIRAGETGNSDPVKRQLAANYSSWLHSLPVAERLSWSKIHGRHNTAERIAAWQSGTHTQIAK